MTIDAVQTRLALTVSDIKGYLSLDASWDLRLELWLGAAKEDADLYLGNPFYERGEDGEYLDPIVELAIPNGVKLGVLEWIRAQAQFDNTNAATGILPAGPVVKDKVRNVERQYAAVTGGAQRGGGLENALEQVRSQHWARYRLIQIGSAGGSLRTDKEACYGL